MNMIMMMLKERKDIKPFLVKFGVALAISFGGFMYSRSKTNRINPSDPSGSPHSSVSDSGKKVDCDEEKLKNKDDSQPEMNSYSVDSHDKKSFGVRVPSSSMNISPGVSCNGEKERFPLPGFDQIERKFNATISNHVVTSVKASGDNLKIKVPPEVNKSIENDVVAVDDDDNEIEIRNLRRRIRFLVEREKKLQVQLLEYQGMKEQESLFMELQNRLKVHNVEAKFFTAKIENLQAENKRLEEELASHSRVVCELEEAKMKIRELKKRFRHETEVNKEQLLELRQRVQGLRIENNEASTSGSNGHFDVLKMREIEELRKSNEKLQQEKDDLVKRLDFTEMLAYSNLEDQDREDLNKENLHLREENKNLVKEVERLKSDRYGDAQELVYLRWINACLRYEMRNYQPPFGKTVARDLSKSLSPKSEHQAKQLILEYADNNTDEEDKEPSIVDFNFDFDFDHWPSSHPSCHTDEHEDSPRSNNSSKKHHSKKWKFFTKLRRLLMGKSSHQHHPRGQVTPLMRSLSIDDAQRKYFFDPHHHELSFGIRSPLFASSSPNSNHSSLDYQTISSSSVNRTSNDPGCSRGGVSFVLGNKSGETCDGQNTDLEKYAQVLKESRKTQIVHKKSASII